MLTSLTALAAVAALTAPTAAVPPKLTPRVYTITITRTCAEEDVSGPNDAAGCYWSSARGRKYLAWGHVGPKHGVPGTVGEWRIDAIPWSEDNPEAFAGLHNERKRVLYNADLELSRLEARAWREVLQDLRYLPFMWLVAIAVAACVRDSPLSRATARSRRRRILLAVFIGC